MNSIMIFRILWLFNLSSVGCSWPEKFRVSQTVRARAAQPPFQQERVLHLHRSGHLHVSGAVFCPLCCPVRRHSEHRRAPRRLPDLCGHHGNRPGHCGQCTGERVQCGFDHSAQPQCLAIACTSILFYLCMCVCVRWCRSLLTQASGLLSTTCLCGGLWAPTSPSCSLCTVRPCSWSFPISSTL